MIYRSSSIPNNGYYKSSTCAHSSAVKAPTCNDMQIYLYYNYFLKKS